MEKELKELKEIEEITTEEDIDKNNPAYFENNENREFYVYEHIRLDNMTCFYVGKGKGERAYYLERNDHHDNISNIHSHAVVIIKDNLTEEEAFELERDTIEDYVFNLGYGIDIIGFNNKEDNEIGYLTNCTWGGEGVSGGQLSEEHKKNLSESMKGKYAGKNHPMYGKHHSEETKLKLSEANKGKHLSEETKLKISEVRKGKNHPLYGKHHSDETKKKMSEKVSRKVICITTGKIFNSMKEAGNYYNVPQCNISGCCRGESKSAGKLLSAKLLCSIPLKWKYLENYNNEFKGILMNPIIE